MAITPVSAIFFSKIISLSSRSIGRANIREAAYCGSSSPLKMNSPPASLPFISKGSEKLLKVTPFTAILVVSSEIRRPRRTVSLALQLLFIPIAAAIGIRNLEAV